MEHSNTNWCQSVTGIVIRDEKVLLARHTYGGGKGLYIVPGGYVEYGETPEAALKREFLEETSIEIEPKKIIAIRFNSHDWYIAYLAEYVSGNATPDNDETDDVVWLDIKEALQREDVPDLTKKLIMCAKKAVKDDEGFLQIPYEGRHGKGELYGVDIGEKDWI